MITTKKFFLLDENAIDWYLSGVWGPPYDKNYGKRVMFYT